MAKRYKVNGFHGYQKIVAPENSDLKKINLAFIKNPESGKYEGLTAGEESAFILTQGNIRFFLEGKLLGELSRKNVFDEPPSGVYLPPYSNYSIVFVKESEICVASCTAAGKNKARLIEKRDVRVKRVGEEPFLRSMNEIMPEDFPAEKLIIGETITDPGNWASYPPHKHDTDKPNEETVFEELYYFKIAPRTGFGSIRIFSNPEDNIFLIKNDEVVTIPRGYHPVSVAPKHQLYYLWVLAGETRKLISFVHPDYRFNGKP
ncbi:MAG: 5-deoxy-glucuronate isomerase [Candidatus Omnitrophica bacterium]|nr:5-deoxy-glucuronate isomerase [Candidatus Omnitrophota bacterium]